MRLDGRPVMIGAPSDAPRRHRRHRLRPEIARARRCS
jgi:hypothetical protein